jgi:hypothetical protein
LGQGGYHQRTRDSGRAVLTPGRRTTPPCDR